MPPRKSKAGTWGGHPELRPLSNCPDSGCEQAATPAPASLEPGLCNERGHGHEKLAHCDGEEPPPAAPGEKPAQQQEPSTAKNKINELQKITKWAIILLTSLMSLLKI